MLSRRQRVQNARPLLAVRKRKGERATGGEWKVKTEIPQIVK